MGNLKGEKTKEMVSDLSENVLGKVNYALCKCHAKYLIQNHSSSKANEAGVAAAAEIRSAKSQCAAVLSEIQIWIL